MGSLEPLIRSLPFALPVPFVILCGFTACTSAKDDTGDASDTGDTAATSTVADLRWVAEDPCANDVSILHADHRPGGAVVSAQAAG